MARPSRRLARLALALLVVGCGGDASRTSSVASDESAPIAAPAPPPTAPPAPEARRAPGDAGAAATADLAASAPPAEPQAPARPAQPAVDPAADPAAGPMLIRTARVSVEVDSLEVASAALRALAQRLGGYVASSGLSAGRDQVRSATLELKVPAARFDQALGGLAPLGRVETQDVSSQDVGEEYVDVAARVANARRLEARLLALLERGTPRLTDVLAVERELARVREEIERAEGRMRYLRARVALSTLVVTVHERAPLVGPASGAHPLREALRQAWRNFVALLAGTIAASGVLLPLGAAGALGWWLWRRRRPRA